MESEKSIDVCNAGCQVKNSSRELTCKLTSSELQQRKESVLASLRSQVIQKKELKNGFAFKFKGTDEILDELTEFIKTERECCNFFIFGFQLVEIKAKLG